MEKIKTCEMSELAPVTGKPGAVLRIAERFTEAELSKLVDVYHAGATIKEIAADYRIGTTTVERILRRRQARRCDSATTHNSN